jgi:hypothetical protein
MNIEAEGNIIMPLPEIHGTGRVISTFALQHLMAAALFTRQAWEIERQNQGVPFGTFFEDIRSYVSGAIMCSAAALEANINELFIAHGGPLRCALSNFDTQFWGEKGIERKRILVKYQEAMRILGKKKFPQHAPFFEDVQCLIAMRNSLVHFKPLWDPRRMKDVDLIEKLQNKFALSSFCDEGADFISMKCMSHACAAWAVLATITFVREFAISSGLQDSFWPFIERLQVR